MRLNGFGFWVESLTQVNLLLAYMQKAVAIAKEYGYVPGKVRVYDGVHERDTGYEVFSRKTYSSFEEAKEKLPIDFAEEQKTDLDGLWFTTLNFECFEVELLKCGIPSVLTFSRGELTAPDELHTVYASTDWATNNVYDCGIQEYMPLSTEKQAISLDVRSTAMAEQRKAWEAEEAKNRQMRLERSATQQKLAGREWDEKFALRSSDMPEDILDGDVWTGVFDKSVLFVDTLEDAPYVVPLYKESSGYYDETRIAIIDEVKGKCIIETSTTTVNNSHGTDVDHDVTYSPEYSLSRMAAILAKDYGPTAIERAPIAKRQYYDKAAADHGTALCLADSEREGVLREAIRILDRWWPGWNIAELLHVSAKSVVCLVKECMERESVIKFALVAQDCQAEVNAILDSMAQMGADNNIIPIQHREWIPVGDGTMLLMIQMPVLAAVEKKISPGDHILKYSHRIDPQLERHTIDGDQLLRVGIHIARALKSLHEKGIIHHDVKPDNVFYTTSEESVHWYLGDFNSARFAEKQYAGKISGTCAFMAPEIKESKPFDFSSDVYSWGRTMFFLAFGQVPKGETTTRIEYWRDNTRVDLIAHYSNKQHYSKNHYLGNAKHKQLYKIIEKAMSEDPSLRYASGKELLEALECIESGIDKAQAPGKSPLATEKQAICHDVRAVTMAEQRKAWEAEEEKNRQMRLQRSAKQQTVSNREKKLRRILEFAKKQKKK